MEEAEMVKRVRDRSCGKTKVHGRGFIWWRALWCFPIFFHFQVTKPVYLSTQLSVESAFIAVRSGLVDCKLEFLLLNEKFKYFSMVSRSSCTGWMMHTSFMLHFSVFIFTFNIFYSVEQIQLLLIPEKLTEILKNALKSLKVNSYLDPRQKWGLF